MATNTEPVNTPQFISPPPSYIQLRCPVCFELLLEDPKLVSCCGHHFCGECLSKLRKKSCPLCTETFQSITDKGHKRILSSLLVYCTNRHEGCLWEGELGSLSAHLSPQGTGDCQFTDVQCTCGQNMLRFLIEEHRKHDCPNRLITCEICKIYTKPYFEYHESRHNLVCPELIVACPFVSCEMTLKRKELKDHVFVCTKNQVKCSFANDDCQWSGSPKGLVSHVSQCHIDKFSSQCAELLKEKDKKIESLTNMIAQQEVHLTKCNTKMAHQRQNLTQQASCIKDLKLELQKQKEVTLQQPSYTASQVIVTPPQLITRDVIVGPFSHLKRTNGIFQSGSIYFTDPPSGLPLELCIYPNGIGGHSTYVSVYLYINQYPVYCITNERIRVDVRLFDHKRSSSHGKLMTFDAQNASPFPHDGRNGIGCDQFISQIQIHKYLHNDSLLFELYPFDD